MFLLVTDVLKVVIDIHYSKNFNPLNYMHICSFFCVKCLDTHQGLCLIRQRPLRNSVNYGNSILLSEGLNLQYVNRTKLFQTLQYMYFVPDNQFEKQQHDEWLWRLRISYKSQEPGSLSQSFHFDIRVFPSPKSTNIGFTRESNCIHHWLPIRWDISKYFVNFLLFFFFFLQPWAFVT